MTSASNQSPALFADLELARRLEKTEATGNIQFVEARQTAFPDRNAEWKEIGGAFAMFDGIDSPVTQTFGLGMFEPLTAGSLEAIENFFHERGAQVFHEVCPLADPSTFGLLNDRGYRLIEFTSVMFRPIDQQFSIDGRRNQDIHVRLIRPGEEQLWADTAADGWSEFGEVVEFVRELGHVSAHSKSISFLAELKDQAIAAGALTMGSDVALLAGASTIPTARRQGAQFALLEERLRYAAARGCTIAMMAALPGSASQRNAERNGFRIAYTRLKWHLPT